MNNRVVIGMSGGVDSSAAAFILKSEGRDVIGVTLRLTDNADESCEKASAVAKAIGIEHITVDLRDVFCEKVMDYFVKEYISGATPNPCVMCNRDIKFGALLNTAHELSADYVATGHYALVEHKNGRYLLKRSPVKKDQSYFLSMLNQEQLKAALFPLGKLEKSEIRTLAASVGLENADNPDSQEICFIPDNDYAKFICSHADYTPKKGNFVDTKGNIIGEHRGIIHYTVGQRKGLGAFGRPMFVTSLNIADNSVILGVEGEQYSISLTASHMNWIAYDTPPKEFDCDVMVRSRASAVPAHVRASGDKIAVEFLTPQRSITPGQTVVLYDGDTVLGGGRID